MARVLIVDDHEDSRDLAAVMLTGAGHAAVLAADGDEALSILERERIDIVVLDIFMPVKDGIEVISDMKRDFPGVKIIAVSAGWSPSSDLGILATARALGAEGALPKPLLRDALVTLVEGLTDADA